MEDITQQSLLESMIDTAMDIAQRAHLGQIRRGSKKPYITHPVRASSIAKRYGYSRTVQVALIVHDAIEDSPDPVSTEREIGRKLPSMLPIVQSMTHEKGSPYLGYVLGLSGDALQAKMSDMEHNLLDGPSERQKQKYRRALLAIHDQRGGPPREIHPNHWSALMNLVGAESVSEVILREFISGTLRNVD